MENDNIPEEPILGIGEMPTMATEAITLASFRRRQTVYMPEQFKNPPIRLVEGIELPLSSVAHYLPQEDKDYSPDESWWLLRGMPKETQVWVEHIYQFEPFHGKIKVLPGNAENWARKWHVKHPSLRRVVNRATALANPQNLFVVNHALARHWFGYQPNRYLNYQIAKNTRDNVLMQVGKMAAELDRNHFIPLSMPNKLFTLNKIQNAAASKDLSMEDIRRFGSVSGLFFLEIWKWIADPESSTISTYIKKEDWGRINFMFVVNNSWFSVNLGDLDQWIDRRNKKPVKPTTKEEEEQLKLENEEARGRWEPLRVQRNFLSNIMALIDFASNEAKKQQLGGEEGESGQPDLTNSSTIKETLTEQVGSNLLSKTGQSNDLVPEEMEPGTGEKPASESSMMSRGRKVKGETSERSSENSSVKPVASAPQVAKEEKKELTDEEIDKRIESLAETDDMVEGTDFNAPSPHVNPLEDAIVSRARKLARDGIISSAALKQAEKLAVAYKSVPNPFGNGLATEFAKVTEEELKVESKRIPTRSKRIFDPSMNFSSIDDVTTKYARETYKKDMLNVAFSIQKSGVAVTGIEVDKVETISGSQLVMLIRTKGINGNQSTLPVIVPDFDDEGCYTSGGTTYRMKNQRVDAPIRLVRPGLVYLTSYSGKIAIQRSDKKVFSYGGWLCDTLNQMEMEGHPGIKKLELGNVFDQSLHLPYAYTTLAQRFKEIVLKDFTLVLDREEVVKLFNEKERRDYESRGRFIVGYTKDKKPVLMDTEGNIGYNNAQFGRLEDILGIDVSKAPHEAAMIGIRGQQQPLGVVIASYIGLTNMLNHLGGRVRRVQSGQRQELKPYEAAIRFSDEVLIVDTRDRRTSLLMMGFKQYSKQISQLSIYGFDKTHSYQHLLDSGSRNSATTVELELMDERFVDPMTERVLKEMGEPTTWQGLLWRSLELLATDYSPEEMDGNFMNFKIHERVNGMMYAELNRSIRQYKMDSRVAKSSLDIKPTAVWSKLVKDAITAPVNDCNPVADLRAKEGVSYIGHGGRSKRSMVARNRKFHKNDAGVISMDTVDSGDTGINIYLSANPNIKTTGGQSKRGSKLETGISSMVSTTMMLAPCIDLDDQWSPREVIRGCSVL